MTEPNASSTSKVPAQAKMPLPAHAATPEGEGGTRAGGALPADTNKSEKELIGEPAPQPAPPAAAAVANRADRPAPASRPRAATTPPRKAGPAKLRRLPRKAAKTAAAVVPGPTTPVTRASRAVKLSAGKSNRTVKAEPAPRPPASRPAAVAVAGGRRAATPRPRAAITTAHRPAEPATVHRGEAASTAAYGLPGLTRRVASATRTTGAAADVRGEVIASVKQAQRLTLDVVTTWADVMGKVAPWPQRVPLVPARSDVVEGVGAVFAVAEELLASQRKFATDLVRALVPAR